MQFFDLFIKILVTFFVLVSLLYFYTVLDYRIKKLHPFLQSMLSGVFLGIITIATYFVTDFIFDIPIYDGRNSLIAMSAVFYGPLASTFTALVVILSEILTGTFHIVKLLTEVTSIFIGYGFMQLFRRNPKVFLRYGLISMPFAILLQALLWVNLFQEASMFKAAFDNRLLATMIILPLINYGMGKMIYFELEKQKEKQLLMHQYDEISALYEEITATEEELRYHYDQLHERTDQLLSSESLLRLILEAENDVIWYYEKNTGKALFSDHLYTLLGYDKEELDIFNHGERLVHPDDLETYKAVHSQILTGESDGFRIEYRMQKKNGDYIWVLYTAKTEKNTAGEVLRIAGSISDINDRKIKEMALYHLAYYDTLTSLPNRKRIQELLKERLDRYAVKRHKGAVVFVDVNNLKRINDTLGHIVGDRVLVNIANEISMQLNGSILGRFSGDEFVLLLECDSPECGSTEDTQAFLADLHLKLSQVFDLFIDSVDILQKEIRISLSMGVALYPDHGLDVSELLMHADAALNHAKADGKMLAYYDDAIIKHNVDKLEMENKLRYALDNHELLVFYQPQYRTEDGSLYGFEALIRWKSPIYGFVSPMLFIQYAEALGLIHDIGRFIFEEACFFAKRINTQTSEICTVSINVSPLQLFESHFIESLVNFMTQNDIQPKWMGIEITESSLINGFDACIEKLTVLKSMDMKISLDDFGTGYSSLNYLQRLPLHVIKIDKSFIDSLEHNDKYLKLTRSIIDLSHDLDFLVVAEGVETIGQLNLLREAGCDFIQGYYLGKPMPVEEALRLIQP